MGEGTGRNKVNPFFFAFTYRIRLDRLSGIYSLVVLDIWIQYGGDIVPIY